MLNGIKYIKDKETKNTIRFMPEESEKSELGLATIYLPKSYLADKGIDPDKGFTMKIVAV